MSRYCDNCNVELIPNDLGHPWRRIDDRPSYQRTLEVSFYGTYGGYIDTFEDDKLTMLICNNCADLIFSKLPPRFLGRISHYLMPADVDRIVKG